MTPAGRLRLFFNLMTFESLPAGGFSEQLERLQDAGFEGVQFAELGTESEIAECRQFGFGIAASGRINRAGEAQDFAERCAAHGYECATLHVGWGLEDDGEAARLIDSVIEASDRWRVPLYIETHRATICQDMWRTVRFVDRFPEMRFNGDFSHWYAGQEMVYGGFDKKLAFIQPVLERVRFLHGRIANPGCIQAALDANAREDPIYVTHFKQLWTACFREFLSRAGADDAIWFAPELLAPRIFYARTFPNAAGEAVEESDRWEQSVLLKLIAENCFDEAGGSV
jgi:hypothetical protein